MKIPDSLLGFSYAPACLLRVEGPDAAVFLQGQFTNDLKGIKPGQSVYGLWLDRKGRVIADSHVVLGAGASLYWIASIASPGEDLARHLGGHIIADDVTVGNETAGWRGFSLVGDGAGAWLGATPRPGILFPGRRGPSENWEWLYPESESAAVDAAVSSVRRSDAAGMERLRISARIPSVPGDIGPADLPNEAGLDEDAISYSKGCYLGQEVMARIKSLGRVRRKLVLVRGSGAVPALPAALFTAARRVGELRSAAPDGAGYDGLALVSVAEAAAGEPLALAPESAPTLRIIPPS